MSLTCRKLSCVGSAGALLLFSNLSLAQSANQNADTLAGRFGATSDSELLRTNIPDLIPGAPPPPVKMANPAADDPRAVERGMKYFTDFNCVGCHAPNGAGGMGPSLSNNKWLFGSAAPNIFLTIVQGRGKGMPAFGRLLPDTVVWDLVAYIHSISQDPDKAFGKVYSVDEFANGIEQVPAEKLQSATPWKMTEPFKNGQKP
jgi:cytochrome c oxidase cbb3-type subunit 3